MYNLRAGEVLICQTHAVSPNLQKDLNISILTHLTINFEMSILFYRKYL
jgi:hypothetical protein